MEKKDKWKHLFRDDEWQYFLRLGNALNEAEEKRTFFETIIGKKQENANYCIYDDFPRSDSLSICREIVKDLSAKNALREEKEKTWMPKRSREKEMMSRLLGELICQGFHDPKKETA